MLIVCAALLIKLLVRKMHIQKVNKHKFCHKYCEPTHECLQYSQPRYKIPDVEKGNVSRYGNFSQPMYNVQCIKRISSICSMFQQILLAFCYFFSGFVHSPLSLPP